MTGYLIYDIAHACVLTFFFRFFLSFALYAHCNHGARILSGPRPVCPSLK